LFTDRGTALTGMGIGLAVWVVVGLLVQIVDRVNKPGRIAPSFWGMHLAHLGIAVVVVGITFVKGYEEERDVRMAIGDNVTIANYDFTLREVTVVDGPNYKALQAAVQVFKNGQPIEVLRPEKRKYFSSSMPMTEAAIDYGWFRDLYVAMGDPIPGDKQQWAIRVYYKPFVSWLWGGAVLMVLGGLLSVSDRRYRNTKKTLAA